MAAVSIRTLLRAIPLTATLGVAAGGWAVVTLDDLPDAVVAGKPVTLTFTVRQHGHTPLDNLRPSIEAVMAGGGGALGGGAGPGGGEGGGRACPTLPAPGGGRGAATSGGGRR